MGMRTDAKMSYDRSTDSRPQVGRLSADSLHVAGQGNAVGRRLAYNWAMVGQMENFVVGEGNGWGMFLMWQLQSADQNHVCRPINIKISGRPTVGFNVTQTLHVDNRVQENIFTVACKLGFWILIVAFSMHLHIHFA